MNIDEALKYATEYQEDSEQEEGLLPGEYVAIVLAAEVKRLREQLATTNKTLLFFYCQMLPNSLSMNGEHSWRFANGWPMTHCVGPTPDVAVQRAIEEKDRFRLLAENKVGNEH